MGSRSQRLRDLFHPRVFVSHLFHTITRFYVFQVTCRQCRCPPCPSPSSYPWLKCCAQSSPIWTPLKSLSTKKHLSITWAKHTQVIYKTLGLLKEDLEIENSWRIVKRENDPVSYLKVRYESGVKTAISWYQSHHHNCPISRRISIPFMSHFFLRQLVLFH